MSILEDLADGLAKDALAAETGPDDKIVDEVAKVVGALSTTLEEAYLTSIRVRRAEARGRRFLEAHIAKNAG
jgi:hypothetical protein